MPHCLSRPLSPTISYTIAYIRLTGPPLHPCRWRPHVCVSVSFWCVCVCVCVCVRLWCMYVCVCVCSRGSRPFTRTTPRLLPVSYPPFPPLTALAPVRLPRLTTLSPARSLLARAFWPCGISLHACGALNRLHVSQPQTFASLEHLLVTAFVPPTFFPSSLILPVSHPEPVLASHPAQHRLGYEE